MEVRKVGWWEKMPLWEKLILGSFLIVPLSICLPVWYVGAISGRDGDTLCYGFLFLLVIGYGALFFNHYYRVGAAPTPQTEIFEGQGDLLLLSRAEYLGGHPLLSEIQVVGLGLTEREVTLAAQAGTATIPLGDISDVQVASEKEISWPVAVAGTAVAAGTKRPIVPVVPKRKNYLQVQYTDETGMNNNVIFGYIAPPHSHEEWRNKIIAARYKLLTGKTLDLV